MRLIDRLTAPSSTVQRAGGMSQFMTTYYSKNRESLGSSFRAYAEDGYSGNGIVFAVILAAPAFALLYLATPNVLARLFPHPPSQTAAMVRLVFLGLIVVASGLPPLVGELLGEADDRLLNALNPTVGLVNIGRDHDASLFLALVVWVAAALATLLAVLMLRARDLPPRRLA